MFGFKATLHLLSADGIITQAYRNVTEIYWNYYPGIAAFESSVHDAGVTWLTARITEFEVIPETEIQEAF